MVWRSGDRVKETTTTTGTGDVTLAGAASGFQAFSTVCANGDQVGYAIVGATEWEVGIGTWNTGNTLTRTRVLASSNSGAVVNFSAGPKDVFNTFPAQHGIGPPVAQTVSVDALIPDGSTLDVSDEVEVVSGKELEIGMGAVLEIS